MNRITNLFVIGILGFAFIACNLVSKDKTSEQETSTTLKWYTIEEAIAANKKNPKQLFVDVYTDWCHWCKVMDQQTFNQPEVIQYINEHYYPVKFNAEQRTPIDFNGKTYQYRKGGRRGMNMLTMTLLKGRPAYPSFAILNKDLSHQRVIAGFKKPDELLTVLRNFN